MAIAPLPFFADQLIVLYRQSLYNLVEIFDPTVIINHPKFLGNMISLPHDMLPTILSLRPQFQRLIHHSLHG
jgi:hypothetical protein